MNTSILLRSAVALWTLGLLSIANAQGVKPAAITPIQQDAAWAVKWWMPRHEEKLAEAQKRGDEVELLFVGDSITHYWDTGLWAVAANILGFRYGCFCVVYHGVVRE